MACIKIYNDKQLILYLKVDVFGWSLDEGAGSFSDDIAGLVSSSSPKYTISGANSVLSISAASSSFGTGSQGSTVVRATNSNKEGGPILFKFERKRSRNPILHK